jgi:superfamily II DNA or RNA helicase
MQTPDSKSERLDRIRAIRSKLAGMDEERRVLEDELRILEDAAREVLPLSSSRSTLTPLQPADKVILFLGLFGARRSLFPKYWENPKTGKKGYSPACDNEWRHGICEKPRIKCADCPHQKFPPLDENAVEAHLRGTHPIGTYAIREDDSCIFVAADFDGDGWWEDARAFRDAAANGGVQVAIERSRSGNGAHAWIFFAEPVPAALARRLATALLARASASRPSMSLRAYDRFFPNQDTMPAGGFGNLIALPLAKGPRPHGNTVFLDDSRNPHVDQWAFLASVCRLTRDQLDRELTRLVPPAPMGFPNSDGAASFSLECDERALDLSCPIVVPNSAEGEITIRLDTGVHIPRTALPPAVVASLKRLATFANPTFYEKQRLRFPTYDTPRFIFAGEWHRDRLVLPRGVLNEVQRVIEDAGGTVTVHDVRPTVRRVRWHFQGDLRPDQERAVREMMKHEHGVLSAPPGAGKTVMGCALIARHRTPALVLVHRTVLLDQWRQEAMRFLGMPKKEVGVWRGKASKLTGRLDIAMLPSLVRLENPTEVFSHYGLVIVDECHHVPAVSFEALLKACSCRCIVGLTATPQRKDGLEKLLYMQCGPIRHTLAPSSEAAVPRVVFVRRSSFHLSPELGPKPSIHQIWQGLVDDVARTEQIASDVWAAVQVGRCPLVLSDRKAHLDKLEESFARLRGTEDVAVFRFVSGDGIKRRRAVRAEIDVRAQQARRYVLFATAALIGEGFDLPRLDTLFLAMPLSFKGRVIQYAGRLHRDHTDKREVQVFDYLDENHPITLAMFRRRASAYRQMRYQFSIDGAISRAAPRSQLGLFSEELHNTGQSRED